MAVQRLRSTAGAAAACPTSTIVITKGLRRPLRGTARSSASHSNAANGSNGFCSHCCNSCSCCSGGGSAKGGRSSKKWSSSSARASGGVCQVPDVAPAVTAQGNAEQTSQSSLEDASEKAKGPFSRPLSIQLTVTRGCILGLMALASLTLRGSMQAPFPTSAFGQGPDGGAASSGSWAAFAASEPALSPRGILRGGLGAGAAGTAGGNADGVGVVGGVVGGVAVGGGGVVVVDGVAVAVEGDGKKMSTEKKAEQRNVNKEARRYALQARAARAAARAAAQSAERAGQAPGHTAPHTATARARRASADGAVRRSAATIAALNRPHDVARAEAALAALPSPEAMSGAEKEEEELRQLRQQQQQQQQEPAPKKWPPVSASSAASVAEKLQAAAAAQSLRESNARIAAAAGQPALARGKTKQSLPAVPTPELLDVQESESAILSPALTATTPSLQRSTPTPTPTLLEKRRQLPATRFASPSAPSRPVAAGFAGDEGRIFPTSKGNLAAQNAELKDFMKDPFQVAMKNAV